MTLSDCFILLLDAMFRLCLAWCSWLFVMLSVSWCSWCMILLFIFCWFTMFTTFFWKILLSILCFFLLLFRGVFEVWEFFLNWEVMVEVFSALMFLLWGFLFYISLRNLSSFRFSLKCFCKIYWISDLPWSLLNIDLDINLQFFSFILIKSSIFLGFFSL